LKRCSGAFGEADVFGFAGFVAFIECRDGFFQRCVGVDAMEVIEIWSEPESFNRTIDVLLDMTWTVCYAGFTIQASNTTL
jgi:hypothetical protein